MRNHINKDWPQKGSVQGHDGTMLKMTLKILKKYRLFCVFRKMFFICTEGIKNMWIQFWEKSFIKSFHNSEPQTACMINAHKPTTIVQCSALTHILRGIYEITYFILSLSSSMSLTFVQFTCSLIIPKNWIFNLNQKLQSVLWRPLRQSYPTIWKRLICISAYMTNKMRWSTILLKT